MKRFFSLMLITASLFLLGACSKDVTVQDPGAKYKNQSEKHIYVAGRKALFNHDWKSCSDHFEGLLTLYPFGQYAQKSQLDLIYCYYRQDDVPLTLASADRYIQLYPMSKNIAYAYYVRGLAEFYENRSFLDQHYNTDYAQRDLQSLRKAFLDFNRIVTDYPRSQYVADAKRRMVYIRNTLALYQLEVARFYYERHAYVAAANRANLLVRHFQGSTAVPDGLALMALSYQQMGLKQSANQALTVLKYNYPNDPDVKMLALNH